MDSLVKIGLNVVVYKIPQISNLHRMNLQAQTLYYIPLIPMVLQVIKKEKKDKKEKLCQKTKKKCTYRKVQDSIRSWNLLTIEFFPPPPSIVVTFEGISGILTQFI